MKILFGLVPERGHMNPLLAVAQRLERAGHELAYFSHEDVAPAIASAGLVGRVFGTGEVPQAGRPRPIRARDAKWLTRWFEVTTAAALAPPKREAASKAVREFEPDVMAIDPLAYAAVAAAEAASIPWAGLSSNFLVLAPDDWTSPTRTAYENMAGSRRALFASCGIAHPVKVNEVMSPWLRVAFTTDAFVPGASEGVFRVGPSLSSGPRANDPEFPWDRLDREKPIVYVSPGGGQSAHSDTIPWTETLTKIFASLEPTEATFVAVLHDLVDEPFMQDLPAHVVGVRTAPQLAILERAAAVVTHGGANTVTETLSNGRPMLVLPHVNDQSLQGLLVERSGVGFTVDPSTLDVATCRDRLQKLLAAHGHEHTRARAIGESFRAQDGAARAAELILELGRTRSKLEA